MNPTSEIALHHYVQESIGKPFEFGVNDCPLFVAGAIDAMYKTDLRSEYTGKWHNQKTAWKFAKKNGDISEQLKSKGCISVELSHCK